MHFAKNMSKNLKGRYSQELLDHTKQTATIDLKLSEKEQLKKTAQFDW